MVGKKNATIRVVGALCALSVLSLLSGCASIKSIFKGSAKKMSAVEATWAEEKYAKAISDAIKIIKDDPDFTKSKEFVRDNYQIAADKTMEQIKAADTLSPMEKTQKQFDLYVSLSNMYVSVKNNTPITGPKAAWTFQPANIPDVKADLEKARDAAVVAHLAESSNLFKANKAEDARKLIKSTMSHYLNEGANDSDAEKATRAKAVAEIVKQALAFGNQAMRAATLADLEEGFKTLDLVDNYAKDNADVAKLKASLEAKVADAYLAEGKKLEAAGDLDSLKAALKTYQDGLKKVSGNAALKSAVATVGDKIAAVYLIQGDEKAKAGDDESLKAAIALYKEGSKTASTAMALTLAAAATKAQDAGAERYYRQARDAEKAMGKDPVKGKEVIDLYKKAQEWVENYRDTKDRIAFVESVTTVTIFVATPMGGNTNLGIEKDLAAAIKKGTGTGYSVVTPADKGLARGDDFVANSKAMTPLYQSINPRYQVAFMVSPNTQKATKELKGKTNGEDKTAYYRELKDGTIELMKKSDYDAAKKLEPLGGGHEKFLQTQGWKRYGELKYHDVYDTIVQRVPVQTIIAVSPMVNGKAGTAIFNKMFDTEMVWESKIFLYANGSSVNLPDSQKGEYIATTNNINLLKALNAGRSGQKHSLMESDVDWKNMFNSTAVKSPAPAIKKSVLAEAQAIIDAVKADVAKQ